MRKSAKRLISAVVAAVSAMTMALSVSAADYASNPAYSGAPSQSVSASTSDIKQAVKDTVTAAIADAAKSDSDNSGSDTTAVAAVEVKSTRNLKITPSIMKDLAKSDNATLKISTPKATISIDSSTITKARNIDLSMNVVNSAKKTTIDMSSKKDFGCEVKITVTTCKMSSEKLAKAHVFCDGEDLGPVELDEDGNPIITVKKGGKYEIK